VAARSSSGHAGPRAWPTRTRSGWPSAGWPSAFSPDCSSPPRPWRTRRSARVADQVQERAAETGQQALQRGKQVAQDVAEEAKTRPRRAARSTPRRSPARRSRPPKRPARRSGRDGQAGSTAPGRGRHALAAVAATRSSSGGEAADGGQPPDDDRAAPTNPNRPRTHCSSDWQGCCRAPGTGSAARAPRGAKATAPAGLALLAGAAGMALKEPNRLDGAPAAAGPAISANPSPLAGPPNTGPLTATRAGARKPAPDPPGEPLPGRERATSTRQRHTHRSLGIVHGRPRPPSAGGGKRPSSRTPLRQPRARAGP
jgi:hypothetical protein